ncbi:hypothetical protein [Consotaella salsifontis]|uniref:Uncharacterized protein n=1 Tax=Consotaella salsifontis TaxID=1365950 RepID=A0A1T4PV22_9HYPH|nr:hypothetical protein [Consotaella salsifontis]SJZ95101.1 hypothetical protein SAMN05428963_104163 [Consotaella salsifontis]
MGGRARAPSPLSIAIVGLVTLLASIPPPQAKAAAGSCTIVVNSSGVLTPDANLTSLSTNNPGGRPASATITAMASGTLPGLVCSVGLPLNCFSVSVTAPSGFNSAPSGMTGTATFQPNVRLASGSSFLNLVSLVVLNGTSTVNFDLTAQTSMGVFRAGNYQVQETVRCE